MSNAVNDTDYVIILDDDPIVQKIIETVTGKKARCFENAVAVSQYTSDIGPLVCFVDIHLGSKDNGLDVLPRLKEKWPFCPIIVITGDRTDDLIGQALAAGADDFIYKPINHKELLARMQARLEELTRREAKEILAFGDISMDLAHRSIHKNTNIRYVSPTEMNLLSCLVQARGGVVRRETLKRRCWGQVFVSDNALNRKLHEVRKALKDIASDLQIRTIYGTGFTVEMSPDSAEALCAQGK